MQPETLTATCCQCHVPKPADAFLPRLRGDGTDRCRSCILAHAARDRAEREARQATRAAEALRKLSGRKRSAAIQRPVGAAGRRPAVEERTPAHV